MVAHLHFDATATGAVELLRRHVDAVALDGPAGAYLDLSGMVAPRAAMRLLVADLRGKLGIHAALGIGPTRHVARIAADRARPHGVVILAAEPAGASVPTEAAGQLALPL